jgi:penicillin-binding protein 2
VPVEAAPELGIDPRHLKSVRDGMYAVSNEGTAYRSRIADPAMLMAGKTGTSQVRIITAAERARGVTKNEQLPWNRRDHALFVAYAPYDSPRYAISLIVEHGGGGSAAAAPIARDILMYALYGGLPPLEAYPAEQRKEIEERRLAEPPATETGAAVLPPRDRA